ncbi:MAG: hypothetical protein Q4B54_04815 [Coriobacteriales bacterium]|nr:hypothetical protein [Coriobacteriales bacterium]
MVKAGWRSEGIAWYASGKAKSKKPDNPSPTPSFTWTASFNGEFYQYGEALQKAFAGQSLDLYYAEDRTTSPHIGLALIVDSSTNQYVMYCGPISQPSETQFTIEDQTSDNPPLTFSAYHREGDLYYNDLSQDGTYIGSARLGATDATTINNEINMLDEHGTCIQLK